jgi:hypothetical protein
MRIKEKLANTVTANKMVGILVTSEMISWTYWKKIWKIQKIKTQNIGLNYSLRNQKKIWIMKHSKNYFGRAMSIVSSILNKFKKHSMPRNRNLDAV